MGINPCFQGIAHFEIDNGQFTNHPKIGPPRHPEPRGSSWVSKDVQAQIIRMTGALFAQAR